MSHEVTLIKALILSSIAFSAMFAGADETNPNSVLIHQTSCTDTADSKPAFVDVYVDPLVLGWGNSAGTGTGMIIVSGGGLGSTSVAETGAKVVYDTKANVLRSIVYKNSAMSTEISFAADGKTAVLSNINSDGSTDGPLNLNCNPSL